MKAYKQFRLGKDGNLYPLFVLANKPVKTGTWLIAEEGQRTEDGKVKSKLGSLAFRPGWHLSEIPYAPHIGIKENGKVKYMKPDTVWALCEVYDENNWTPQAQANGINGDHYDCRKACLKHIPYGGFYYFNTNPNAFGRWMIAEKIKVVRVLTDAEVEDICWNRFGIHAQPRKAV